MTKRGNKLSGSILEIALLTLVFTGLAKAPPDTPNLQAKLDHAQALARRGEVTAAEQEYLAVIRLDPESYEAHNDLGALYMSAKRYDSACHEFAQAANLNQKAATIQKKLGHCSIQANHFAQAAEALKKAE